MLRREQEKNDLRASRGETGVALVTGAAGRIGAAIARGLSGAGFAVIVHYRSGEAEAQALAAALGRAAAIRADLADRAQRRTLVARAAEKFGPLTLLVNNASSFEPDQVSDLDEALWDRHFAVHAEAPAFLGRDFAAQLPEGETGNIVNIVDERVLHLSPANFSYTLSKSVLWTMTRTMAQTLAPAIRVNAVGPGPTLPHAGQDQATFERQGKELLLGRPASPQDIADAVLFLVRAGAVTGQMLAVDGGAHLYFKPRRGPTPRKS